MRAALVLLSFIATVQIGFCQQLQESNNAFANKLRDSLDLLSAKKAKELVYIQTNKQVFEKGEDLWFSATVLNSQSLLPSRLTQTLYVELRSNAKNDVITREMYSIEAGFVEGHLFIADSLDAGTYWLIAFTDHSVAGDKKISSVRKLTVKDRIVPQVFITTEFDKTNFSNGGPIEGTVELRSANRSRLADLRTVLEFRSGGKLLERIRGRSDEQGRLSFKTRALFFSGDATLTVIVSDKNQDEQHTISIPLDWSNGFQLHFMPEGGNIISGISNHVAFKAVSGDGKPFDFVKAQLYADDKPVSDIRTDHAGMGRFHFFADGSKQFHVKILEPIIESEFRLPEFDDHGIRLHLKSKDSQRLVFSVLGTSNLITDSVRLAVKQRGSLVWMATTLLTKKGQILNVPISELSRGIVEVTLYNAAGAILAERLVFIHLDRQLHIDIESNERDYGTKEYVTMKIKVKDQSGDPVQSRFTASVVDEVYSEPFAEKTIASHFLLSSELKGELFDPTYYFEPNNLQADPHLDLLMLTQGWRSYEWHAGHLLDLKEAQDIQQIGSIIGSIDLKSLSGVARRKDRQQVQLIGNFGVMMVMADSLGDFRIPEDALMASKGAVIMVKVLDDDDVNMKFTSSFDRTGEIRNVDHLSFGRNRTAAQTENWNENSRAIDDVVELEEVEITAKILSYDKYWGQKPGMYLAKSMDYVCQYNILNCRNHPHGVKPVPGRIYTNNDGKIVVYRKIEKEEPGLSFVKGHYQIPSFFQPDYVQNPNETLIPDFRNTLFWEPALITDENGEVEISFFTSDIRSIFKLNMEGMGVNGQFGVGQFELRVLK